jgi:hypothetical protein
MFIPAKTTPCRKSTIPGQGKQSVPGVKRHYYHHHSSTVHQMLQNTLPKNHVAFVVYLCKTKLKNSGQLIFLFRVREKNEKAISSISGKNLIILLFEKMCNDFLVVL